MAMQITSLSKSFGVDLILENISMNITDNEKVGLIGANGAGKTSLLRIISGEIPHDSGSIFLPKDATVGFLKQNAVDNTSNTMWEDVMEIFAHITSLENEMRNLEVKMSDESLSDAERSDAINSYSRVSTEFETKGGFEIRTRIKTVLNGMGFEDFDVKNTKVSSLSGGEKTKFAFAKLLLTNPDVLLLDEPTNHLDFRTMQWLEGYLKSYRGIIIAVSHDRYFLDSLCDTIYEIERNKCTRFLGNYSAYLVAKEKNYEIALKHYEAQREEIKRLEDYVARNKTRASTAKMAKSKQKAIDRIEVLEKPTAMNKACRFNFELEFHSYKDVLVCEDVELKVNAQGIARTIARGINADVKRGEKVAIIGSNGVGKSTLLKTLVGINTMHSGHFEFGRNVELSYYDQEQKLLHEKKTVLDEIWDRFPRMDETEVRTLLGTVLFTDEDVYKQVSLLSGGERARLMLLIISLEKANTLLLDEPTNHLDLSSKESLDTAVKNFDGTVILVSHDRYFLNKIADRILELTPNGIISYEGNYNDYLERKNFSAATVVKLEVKSGTSAAEEYEANKRKQANLKNLSKKLSQTERDIEALEQKNEELKEKIAEAGADFVKAGELFSECEKNEKKLNDLYELWNTLSIELENNQ